MTPIVFVTIPIFPAHPKRHQHQQHQTLPEMRSTTRKHGEESTKSQKHLMLTTDRKECSRRDVRYRNNTTTIEVDGNNTKRPTNTWIWCGKWKVEALRLVYGYGRVESRGSES